MPNYNFKALTKRRAPERMLIMKNVLQQVDQRPTINSKSSQKYKTDAQLEIASPNRNT